MLTSLLSAAALLALAGAARRDPAARQAPDTTPPVASTRVADSARFSSPGVAALVRRAQVANRRVPVGIDRYTAQIESEIGLVLNVSMGTPGAVAGTAAASTEQAGQVEQVQSRGSWQRSGAYEQHIVGYRSQMLGPSVSALTWIRGTWTAPILYGNRLSIFFGGGARRDSVSAEAAKEGAAAPRDKGIRTAGGADSARRLSVHPFAQDADTYYRFAGGDTVARMTVGARLVTVVRVAVEPVAGATGNVLLFGGELFVDASPARSTPVKWR